MTKTQLHSLAILIALIFGVSLVSWMAYDRYHQANEEALVFIGIFQPTHRVIEFESVIALSKPSICSSSAANYEGLPTDVVSSFITINEKNSGPIRLSKLEGKVPVVGWEDTKKLHENRTVNFFHPENYKLLYLSRVGFNSEFTEAIACVELSQESYGRGMLFYLKKETKAWRIVEERNIWVS